jgi:hypothetical protein
VTPPPVVQTPAPVIQTPTPVVNAPVPQTDLPSAPVQEHHSASHEHKAVADSATVAAASETPASNDNAEKHDAPAPAQSQSNPEAILVGAVDSTGTRVEVVQDGDVVQTEEGAKLVRVLWTFVDEQMLQKPATADSEEVADASQAAVAVVAPDTQKADLPLVIQLVQEIDVTPEAAAQAAAQGAVKSPQTIEVTYSNAGLGLEVSDAPTANRNFALALLLGVMTLGVQWYRSSKKKLASAARTVFDPLGAWLDDPHYRD